MEVVFRPRAHSPLPGVWLLVLGASSLILFQLLRALFGKPEPALKTASSTKSWNMPQLSLPHLVLAAAYSHLLPMSPAWAALQPRSSHVHPGQVPYWSRPWLKLTDLTSDLPHHCILLWQSSLLSKSGWASPNLLCSPCSGTARLSLVSEATVHVRLVVTSGCRFTFSFIVTCPHLVPDR